jgi:DNA helicase HerA-like ATPase
MSRRPDNSLQASHTLVTGGTGSGKTSWVRKFMLPKEKRIIVWDGKDEFEPLGFERITRPADLARRIATGKKTGKIAFAAPLDQFSFWARAAWAWGHALVIAEELADVTNPAKAPQAWGELIRKGRGHGLRTVTTTQRPAEIDKTTVGNATQAMTGFLAFDADRKYVATKIGFPREDLDALEPGEYLFRVLPRGPIETGRTYPKSRKPAGTGAKS